MFDRKKIQGLLWPVIVEQGVAIFINFLATIMVRSVSPAAMAGVGLLSTVNFLMMNAFAAVATGVTVIVSQNIGRGDHTAAGKAAAQSIVVVVYISIVLGGLMAIFHVNILQFLFNKAEQDVLDEAATYLVWSALSLPLQALFSTIAGIMRSTGNSRTPMVGSIFSNFAYIVAGSFCIYLMRMGVEGAGIGLTASRLVPAVFLSVMAYKDKAGVKIPRLSFKLDGKILGPVLKIAIPSGVDSLIFNGGKLVVSVFMSGMGTPVLVANSIVNNLSSIINLPASSLQIITVTIVGQTFGAGKIKEVRKQILALAGIGGILELAVMAVGLPLSGWMVNLFSPPDIETFTHAHHVLLLILIATPLAWSPSFLVPTGLRATGDATFTMWVSISSMIILRVAGAWFFGVFLDMKLFGIWLSMIVDWVGRASFFMPRAMTIPKRFIEKTEP